MKSIYEKNGELLMELAPEVRWAAVCWMKECFDLNYEFRITEAYRSQERQNQLYAQGRTKPGPVVTWTKNSNHTKRLAVDVYPINCTYAQISSVARKYGITHPIPKDQPHFEFINAKKQPERQRPATPREAIRAINRKLKTETNPRIIARLEKSLQEEHAKL